MDARELNGKALFAYLLRKALERALCNRNNALADELACACLRVGAA